MLLGHASFSSSATLLEMGKTGYKIDADMPTKHLIMHEVIKKHLSQSTGAGAFDGQHGMALVISSVIADADVSSAIADIETSEDVSVMACAIRGRENGANANPAIMTIASSRRMVIWRFTPPNSHRCG